MQTVHASGAGGEDHLYKLRRIEQQQQQPTRMTMKKLPNRLDAQSPTAIPYESESDSPSTGEDGLVADLQCTIRDTDVTNSKLSVGVVVDVDPLPSTKVSGEDPIDRESNEVVPPTNDSSTPFDSLPGSSSPPIQRVARPLNLRSGHGLIARVEDISVTLSSPVMPLASFTTPTMTPNTIQTPWSNMTPYMTPSSASDSPLPPIWGRKMSYSSNASSAASSATNSPMITTPNSPFLYGHSGPRPTRRPSDATTIIAEVQPRVRSTTPHQPPSHSHSPCASPYGSPIHQTRRGVVVMDLFSKDDTSGLEIGGIGVGVGGGNRSAPLTRRGSTISPSSVRSLAAVDLAQAQARVGAILPNIHRTPNGNTRRQMTLSPITSVNPRLTPTPPKPTRTIVAINSGEVESTTSTTTTAHVPNLSIVDVLSSIDRMRYSDSSGVSSLASALDRFDALPTSTLIHSLPPSSFDTSARLITSNFSSSSSSLLVGDGDDPSDAIQVGPVSSALDGIIDHESSQQRHRSPLILKRRQLTGTSHMEHT